MVKGPVPVTHPVPWEDLDVYALKAVAEGKADAAQQKRAMDWIIHKAAGTYDMSYRPGNVQDTVFAEGRRFVGLQIVKLVAIDIARVKQAERAKGISK